MKLVPQLNSTGEIEDGSYIRALDFCQRNCNKGRCKTFYNSIMSAPLSSGFLTCPYGMSVYVSALEKQIYCSMRERETYNKKLSKNIADARKLYNPVLPAEQLYTLIQASQTITVGKKKLDEKQAVVDSISHEVKKLNGQIKEHSDLAISLLKADDDVTPSPENVAKVYEELRSIFLSSSMIASRYTLFDYEKNPDVLKGTIVETSIHKTFYKLAKIFRNYRKRNIPIILSGSTFRYIDAYDSFDLIPLLLIENAVKYSYYSSDVQITFSESSSSEVDVSIESYSPYCSKEDLTRIFEKGFRGKNASKVADGNGIGLFFVKKTCDIHNIGITVESDNSRITPINSVAYAPFRIMLHFTKTYNVDHT